MRRINRGTLRRTLGSALLVGLALLVLIVSTRSLSGLPERVGLSVMSFFQRGFDAVSSFVGDTINSVAELRRLQDSYEELLGRVERLGNLERDYSDLKQENERLKEQLGYSLESSQVYVSAKIIARDPENVYSSLVINKGAIHGIVKNDAVVAYQDGSEGLVGRVVEVSRSTCIVAPIFDASTYVAIKLERSRYDGLALGQGSADLPLVIRYVKKRAKDEIQYGDLVVTSGMQSLYPAGIGVGRVTKVSDRDYLTSLELEMEPTLDFGRLEYVFVITDSGDGAAGKEP